MNFIEHIEKTSDRDWSAKKVAIPVNIGIEPMKRLLIADFIDDPEFEAIEPQLFSDVVNGNGLRILLYRKDKKVDVYYQRGIWVDPSTFNIGDGIGVLKETIIEPAVFNITPNGIDLHCQFTDIEGRIIELKIKENTRDNKRFSFLAPVGNDIREPKQLFLAYMKGFDFIRKKNTVFFARIDKRVLKPAGFPLTRCFKRVYFARYSTEPNVGTFNPPMNKPLIFNYSRNKTVEVGNMTVQLDNNGRVKVITTEYMDVKAAIHFPEGYPNLLELDNSKEYSGDWNYLISGVKIVSGIYKLFRNDHKVLVQFEVTEPWRPVALPFNFKVFTTAVSHFKKWPTTYKWNGIVEISNDMNLSGCWERIGISPQ